MTTKFKFTKKSLSDLKSTDKRKRYYDAEVAGLILEVSPAGKKSFRVYKRMKGESSPVNVTLGGFPDLTIEQAREAARSKLNLLVRNENPNRLRRAEIKANVSMRKVYEDYIAEKSLTESTQRGYRHITTCYLKDYLDEPLNSFDEEAVRVVHKSISLNSKAQADLTMRFVRALFNFAKFEYRDGANNIFDKNPVEILTHLRAWHHVGRKQSYLNSDQLTAFMSAINEIRNEAICLENLFPISVCDYIEVALFTGLRKTELVKLKWKHVDLELRQFWVEETKNGEPLLLPISDHLYSIFLRRNEYKSDSEFVFNANNNLGRIIEPKKVLYKVSEAAGIKFTMHDLRRTFTTVAERIQTSTYTLKRLLNHKSGRNDVTAGYTILTPEELREPAHKIEDKILELSGHKSPSDTVENTNQLIDIQSLSREEKLKLATELLSDVK